MLRLEIRTSYSKSKNLKKIKENLEEKKIRSSAESAGAAAEDGVTAARKTRSNFPVRVRGREGWEKIREGTCTFL